MPIELSQEQLNQGVDIDAIIGGQPAPEKVTPVEETPLPKEGNPNPGALVTLRKDLAVPTESTGEKDQIIQGGDPATPPQSVDIASFIAEKSGGKFKTWEEIEQALSRPQAPSIEFKDDFSRSVFEGLMAGEKDKVMDVLVMQHRLKDADNWDSERAVREAMSLEHPDWTAEDIDDEYNALIPQVEDDAEPADKRRATRALNDQAKKAKEYLAGLRKDLKLPEVKGATSGQSVDPAQVKAARDKYVSAVNEARKKFTGYDFHVADDDMEITTKFNVDPEESKRFLDTMSENDIIDATFQSNYVNEDGSYNVESMAKDMWLLQRDDKGVPNYEKVVVSQIKQVFTEAKRAILASFKGRPEVQGLPGNVGQSRLRTDIENYMKQTS